MNNATTIHAYDVESMKQFVIDCIDEHYKKCSINHKICDVYTNVVNHNTIRMMYTNQHNDDEIALIYVKTRNNINVIDRIECENHAIAF